MEHVENLVLGDFHRSSFLLYRVQWELSTSIRSLRTCSDTCSSPASTSLSRCTRSLGTVRLFDHRLRFLEGHLVLGLRDLRARHRLVDVLVRDRLAVDARLLAAHRHGVLDVFGFDVLLPPGAAALALGGPDADFLLGTRHGVSAAPGPAAGVASRRLGQ